MEELLSDLKIELSIDSDETSEDALLTRFLNKAINKVLNTRYPYGYNDSQNEQAIQSYRDNILDIAVYIYNKQGAEGQTSHSENGIYRTYEKSGIPSSYTADIVPVVKAL